MFHVFASLAEFERDLIRERTIAGLVAARARRRRGGRPTIWTTEKLRAARSMHLDGQYDVATIARVLGVSRASVYRALASVKENVTTQHSKSARVIRPARICGAGLSLSAERTG